MKTISKQRQKVFCKKGNIRNTKYMMEKIAYKITMVSYRAGAPSKKNTYNNKAKRDDVQKMQTKCNRQRKLNQ